MPNHYSILSKLTAGRDYAADARSEEARLLACYRLSTPRDRRIIWAVLNEYAPAVDL